MDFQLNFGDFSSTTINVRPVSEAGADLFSKMFGNGVVSVDLPKSKGQDFLVFIQQKGLNA